MTINFQDPRLQRQRQKMAALSPESAAIFDTAAATSEFAKNDMIKQLALMRIGNQLKTRQQNFDLMQQERINRLDLAREKLGIDQGRLKLEEKDFKFGKKQGKTATVLSALGMIPKAYMGYKVYQQSGQNAKDLMELARNIQSASAGLGG